MTARFLLNQRKTRGHRPRLQEPWPKRPSLIIRFMLSWIEIDASRLRSNIDAFRSAAGPGTSIMAVIKANAYGHGLEVVARVVAERADWLGVNCIDEALTITRLGIEKPVAILGHTPLEQLEDVTRNGYRQ